MIVNDLIEKLELSLVSGSQGIQNEVLGGYTSDLLSDVMGNISSGAVWITLQSHKNVLAIASLKDVSAVIIVNGFKPEEDTVLQSNKENIPILVTQKSAFEVSGKLYALLNK